MLLDCSGRWTVDSEMLQGVGSIIDSDVSRL